MTFLTRALKGSDLEWSELDGTLTHLKGLSEAHDAALDPHPQYMTSAEVDTRVAQLVDAAPATLDTLNELAAALGDDPNFATTMTSALAGKQASDPTLTALAAVVTAADKLIYATGADTFATADLTAAGRALLDDADAAAQRTTLGLGTAATATLTTSATDATPGRVLKVGDFGFGSTATGLAESAMDNADLGSGIYNVSVAALGVAPINTNGYLWNVDNASAGYAAREYHPVTSTRRFVQTKAAGTWGSWFEFAFLGAAQTWTGKQTFNGYTVLGESAPAMKFKKLTGTTAATEGGTVSVAHGLTSTKFLPVTVQVAYASGQYVPHGYTSAAGFQFDFTVDGTNVVVRNHATNSENILSKAFTVLIPYEE